MRGQVLLVVSAMTIGACAAIAACNGDDSNNPLPAVLDAGNPPPFDASLPSIDASHPDAADAAHTPDAADSAPEAAPVDSGPILYNGCGPADFADADYSAPDAARVIYFPDSSAPANYKPPCMTIKAGESVAWVGDFNDHPLVQSSGFTGPLPPITGIGIRDAGPDSTFWATFYEAGVFPYECQVHSNMLGAVNVTP